jgi:hypothetical protein
MFQKAAAAVFRLRLWISPSRGAVFVLALVPFVGGCGGGASGPPRAAVSGQVRLDEVPLKAGIIRFVPAGATKGPVALTTIKEGRYELSNSNGPALGKNSIEIVGAIADNPLTGATDIKAAWAEYAKSSGSRPPEITIPKKYNRNSMLSVVVTATGDNTFDFKLASP